jgi:hypothetical protein
MKVRRSRVIAIPGAALLAVVVLAACGGSSTTSSTTNAAATNSSSSAAASVPATSATAVRSKLAACLKKYGVTLPAGGFGAGRPGGFGGGRFGATGATGPFRRFGSTGATGAAGAGRRIFGATGATGAPGARFPGGGFAGANPKFATAFAKCGGAAGFGGGFGRGRFGATGAGGAPGAAGGVANPRYRTDVISYAACMKADGIALPKPNFSGTGFVFGTKVNQKTAAFVAANAKCQGLLSAAAPAG